MGLDKDFKILFRRSDESSMNTLSLVCQYDSDESDFFVNVSISNYPAQDI